MDRKVLSNKREENVEVAEIVATQLNDLIDKGLLKVESVEKASVQTMEEFMRRYRYNIVFSNYSEKDKEKIRTLFSSHLEEKMQAEKYPDKERLIEISREILFELRRKVSENSIYFLLLGSRMDPEKQPRSYPRWKYNEAEANDYSTSDLDLIFIDGSKNITMEDYENISSFIRRIKHHNFPDLDGMKIELNYIRPLEEILSIIDQGYVELKDMPNWSWKPDSAHFIGSICKPEEIRVSGVLSKISGLIISEKDVNRFLKDALNSDESMRNRQLYLEDVKNRILELIYLKKS